jgi:hypothetical protein
VLLTVSEGLERLGFPSNAFLLRSLGMPLARACYALLTSTKLHPGHQ